MGRRRAVRAVLVAAVTVAIAAGGVSCTKQEGDGLPPLAPLDTSTVLPQQGTLSPTTTEPGPSKVKGLAFAQIAADFDQATSARDFCGLLGAMQADLPDVDDRQSVIDTYRKVADSVRSARAFVPSSLKDQWPAVETATENAAKAAERSGGQIDDPALQGAFGTGDFQQASVELDAWSDEHCSSSAATTTTTAAGATP